MRFKIVQFFSEPPPLVLLTSLFADEGLELNWKLEKGNAERIVIDSAINNEVKVVCM